MKRIFDHIDLRVRNFAESVLFYSAFLPLLGFTERVEIEGWLQFEAPGAEPNQFFGVTEDRQHRPNRSRVAFWAESKERVDELAVQLKKIGARSVDGPEYISPSYYAVYFDDPSDNPLEICFRSRRFSAE